MCDNFHLERTLCTSRSYRQKQIITLYNYCYPVCIEAAEIAQSV